MARADSTPVARLARRIHRLSTALPPPMTAARRRRSRRKCSSAPDVGGGPGASCESTTDLVRATASVCGCESVRAVALGARPRRPGEDPMGASDTPPVPGECERQRGSHRGARASSQAGVCRCWLRRPLARGSGQVCPGERPSRTRGTPTASASRGAARDRPRERRTVGRTRMPIPAKPCPFAG